MTRLLHDLAVGRGDGSYTRLLARLGKLDLLAIDDWLLAPLRDSERRDLIEVVEERSERSSTLIATTPRLGLARRHRRSEPGRCHLRPSLTQRAPDPAQGSIHAADPIRTGQVEGVPMTAIRQCTVPADSRSDREPIAAPSAS